MLRSRDADQIVKDRFAVGCGDYYVVFIALLRARKIPTRYLELAQKRWIARPELKRLRGHAIVGVDIGNTSYFVDPTRGEITPVAKKVLSEKWVVIGVGRDAWAIGIRNHSVLQARFAQLLGKSQC